MDSNRKQHTNIIDNLDEIALAQQGRKRKAASKKKAGGVGVSVPPVAIDANAKPKKRPAAPKTAVKRFYEKNGVKIPLYEKGGKKRAHARLSGSLRNKNTEFLLDLVEEYAGAAKKKEFKDADKTKSDMADWIEEHETYALGPNPKSKLDITMPLEDDHKDSFDFEEEEALWADPPPETVTYNGKGKKKATIDAPRPMHLEGREGSKARIHTPEEDPGTKRKCNDKSEPAHAPEQTTKKLKIHQAREQLAKQAAAGVNKTKPQSKDERRKSRIEEKMAEFSKTAVVSNPDDTALKQTPEEKARLKAEDLKAHNAMMEGKMAYLGLHPDNVDTSSMVVNLPEQGEDRILTAVTNPWTKKHVLHDTPIPHDRTQLQAPRARRAEKPFLKGGMHGRGGDFENDPDRRTGRGHEVTTEDQSRHEEYLLFRAAVHAQYRHYPAVAQGLEVDPAIKQAWDENEIWNNSFTYKYSANVFNHLWPCGCEKVRGESEDEESEEE